MGREELRTPCYVIQEEKLKENLQILKDLREKTGCRILLAQKAFSMYSVYPLIGEYLDGTTASGLYEARLGYEEMGLENHIFSPAYREEEMEEILKYCGHVVFNSPAQLRKYRDRAKQAGRSIGLRINPECSTQEGHAIYDPCAPFSRLGTTAEQFRREMTEEDIQSLDGIHFHTLCEQNADALAETLEAVEEKFGGYLSRMKWINFGGGHHITRKDYDRALLEKWIRRIKETYDVEVYLEPGEAVALDAGVLLTRVLEIVENGMKIAILDTSAACHMPDVLEMPYRPPLKDAGEPEKAEAEGAPAAGTADRPYVYRLAGPTCLAGDVIGDYTFRRPLCPGDRLEFRDMAIYTMVKNNTFNGMKLPDIVLERENGDCQVVRKFGYEDFRCRL